MFSVSCRKANAAVHHSVQARRTSWSEVCQCRSIFTLSTAGIQKAATQSEPQDSKTNHSSSKLRANQTALKRKRTITRSLQQQPPPTAAPKLKRLPPTSLRTMTAFDRYPLDVNIPHSSVPGRAVVAVLGPHPCHRRADGFISRHTRQDLLGSISFPAPLSPRILYLSAPDLAAVRW